MKRVFLNIIKQSRHYTMTMNAFVQRQQQAEQTVQLLKQELAALAQIAESKQKIKEQNEIETIKAENKLLEESLQNLKSQLQYYETQNGVRQVVVPKRKEPTTVLNGQLEEQPAKQGQQQQQQPAKKEEPAKPMKTKEPKNKGKPAANTAPGKAVDISRVCMKVGKIIDCKKHPDADGLLVETVEFGEEKPRTICSGIIRFYSPESMLNRLAIFICNLKPVKMRGISSEGMIMCASTPDKVEIVDVPEGAQIGDRVQCPDYPGEPDALLAPKKKIWEQVQPELSINGEGIATYKGSPFTIEGKGRCTAPSMKDCPIK